MTDVVELVIHEHLSSWKMKTAPRLVIGDRKTIAFRELEMCANPAGHRPRQWRNVGDGYITEAHETKACYHLASAGWAEVRRSGPRGGKRWHTTPMGNTILTIMHEHESPYTAFILMGLPNYICPKRYNYERNAEAAFVNAPVFSVPGERTEAMSDMWAMLGS